jgi:hypothetical protein
MGEHFSPNHFCGPDLSVTNNWGLCQWLRRHKLAVFSRQC